VGIETIPYRSLTLRSPLRTGSSTGTGS
jgi:hypothetical protein